MGDKREILHDVKYGFMHYTEIDMEDLNDIDIAMVIVEKFGNEGLFYLQEYSLIVDNHIWDQLSAVALRVMDEKYFCAPARSPRSLCRIRNLLAMEFNATENRVAYLVKSSASFTKP